MFPVLLRDRWENSARRLWYKFKLFARLNVRVDKNFFTSDAAMRLSAGVLPRGVRITCAGRSDGAGMQALAYMSTINFAQAFGAVYVHSPFTRVDHAPGHMLEWAAAWEAQFNFGQGAPMLDHESDIVIDYADYLSGKRTLCARSVLRFQQCWWLNRRYPDSFQASLRTFGERFRRIDQPDLSDKLVVAVHVRRGDVANDLNARRFTPNTSILARITRLQRVLAALQLDYVVDVYSQGDAAAFAEFSHLGCRLHLDADAVWTMRKLAQADVLVMAKSSFSYAAALVNPGVKIYEPTFNPPLSDWIVARRDGFFDEALLKRQLWRHPRGIFAHGSLPASSQARDVAATLS
jgi:hypothetical protein